MGGRLLFFSGGLESGCEGSLGFEYCQEQLSYRLCCSSTRLGHHPYSYPQCSGEEEGASGGGSGSSGKEGDRDGPPGTARTGLLLHFVSGSEGVRRVPSGSGPQEGEWLGSDNSLQDGDFAVHYPVSGGPGLPDVYRSAGCLSACSHGLLGASEVSAFCDR